MKTIFTATTIILGLTAAAIAHSDVKNSAVKARMESMMVIGNAMKTLGGMAKGAIAFDAAAAQTALDTVAAQAANIPAAFQAEETDPASEAKAEIWTNWDDFVAKSEPLKVAAEGASVTDPASAGAALGALGGTCKSCHSAYRM